MFSLSANTIDVVKLLEEVKDDSAGAIVLFLGTVRNHNEHGVVSGIYYEAYIRMAEEAMAEIEAEALKRWNLKKFAGIHRIGDLEIGEVSVAIAVSSEHRAEAFEAGKYAIDRIKREVPIWKKEMMRGIKDGIWKHGTVVGRS